MCLYGNRWFNYVLSVLKKLANLWPSTFFCKALLFPWTKKTSHEEEEEEKELLYCVCPSHFPFPFPPGIMVTCHSDRHRRQKPPPITYGKKNYKPEKCSTYSSKMCDTGLSSTNLKPMRTSKIKPKTGTEIGSHASPSISRI